MANTYLRRNEVDPAGNSTTFTLSQWVKRSKISAEQAILSHRYTNTYYFHVRFNDNDTINIEEHNGGTQTILLTTNRVFRDTNAFYNFVVAVDTTQGTASNRIKFYVNGVQETSFSTANYPNINSNIVIDGGAGYARNYGDRGDGAMYFSGLMSHIHYTQGTAYDASAFGETDATTGEWKGKTSPSVTYGTKGYFILKDGNGITDQSGEGNDFTLGGGTLTDLKDNPDNVFATWNVLTNMNANGTFSNGNNTVFFNNTTERHILATLGMNSGKFYWENKLVSHSGDSLAKVGIESSLHNNAGGYAVDSYGYRGEGGGKKVNNGTFTNWGSSYTAGDIIGCAVDLDNNKIYFSKNGTWQESGDPTSGSTGTGSAFDLIAPVSGFYHPSIGKEASSTATWSMNFGNGYFGTTAVTTNSGNGYAGAEGASKFNYTVPTGYSALSTKGLNE
jgi:hypothetical protein